MLLAEAEARGLEVPDAVVNNTYNLFRALYPSEQAFHYALRNAGFASEQALRESIRQDALLQQIFDELRQDIEVSDREVQTFYLENQELFRVAPGLVLPLTQVDGRIREVLQRQKLIEQVRTMLVEAGVEIYAGRAVGRANNGNGRAARVRDHARRHHD